MDRFDPTKRIAAKRILFSTPEKSKEKYKLSSLPRSELFKIITSIEVESDLGKKEAVKFLYDLSTHFKQVVKAYENDNLASIERAVSTVEQAFNWYKLNSTYRNSMPLLGLLLRLTNQNKDRLMESRRKIWNDLIISKFWDKHPGN